MFTLTNNWIPLPRLVTESYLASINNLVDRDLNAVKNIARTSIFDLNKKIKY